MEKALESIPKEDRQTFYEKWITLGEFSWFDRQVLNIVLSLFAIASVLLIISLLWIRTIRRKDESLEHMNLLLENQLQHLHETQAQLVEIEKSLHSATWLSESLMKSTRHSVTSYP